MELNIQLQSLGVNQNDKGKRKGSENDNKYYSGSISLQLLL